MASTINRRPTAWAVLADSDSDSDAAGPVAVAAPKGAAAAQKKPTRRVSFAPLPKPLHARAAESVDTSVVPTGRLSAVATAADLGASLEENEWAGRDITPVLEAMFRGDADTLWGDLVFVAEPLTSRPLVAPTPVRRRANTVDDFWAQAWATNLTELWSDAYDTSRLTDAEWEGMMTWLFDNGWDVSDWDRLGVSCEYDNEPPRVWIAPRILEELAAADASAPRRGYSRSCGHRAFPEPDHGACGHTHPKPAGGVAHTQKAKEKVAVVIPRFCRAAGACTDAGCRYTHGDTIPVQNKPCSFDGRCCGDKRATCTYLHPSEGEVWTADLVRHRPAAPAPTD
jgi:hypothetical protein